MAVRVVEWKKPYTWGKAITVDENKVISLNLRAENNLIIYDEWDDEIYVDLQLRDWITPMSAFPVWVTTGRVAMEDWWDADGTIVVFKTTSWDNIKLFYSDNVEEGWVITEPWKLYIDNWTGTFKQIYFKSDVDQIITLLQQSIATKQDKLVTISVTLTTAWWSSNEQTVTATWVTADNTVIVSPDPSSLSDYTTGGIYCSAQGTDSLTFNCSLTPSSDIDVNVVIIN